MRAKSDPTHDPAMQQLISTYNSLRDFLTSCGGGTHDGGNRYHSIRINPPVNVTAEQKKYGETLPKIPPRQNFDAKRPEICSFLGKFGREAPENLSYLYPNLAIAQVFQKYDPRETLIWDMGWFLILIGWQSFQIHLEEESLLDLGGWGGKKMGNWVSLYSAGIENTGNSLFLPEGLIV